MPTENEWCTGHNSIAMTARVQGLLGERKLRLIAVACCRQFAATASPDWGQEGLRAAELFADGLLTAEDFALARQRILEATAWAGDWADETSEENAARAIRALLRPKAGIALREVIDALERCAHLAGDDTEGRLVRSLQELKRQAGVLREIVGNPFSPAWIAPEWKAWHGECLVRLAAEIYETRTFEDIPILGDMLEDAGCTDSKLLDHCRTPQPHVLGCWLLDGILDKK